MMDVDRLGDTERERARMALAVLMSKAQRARHDPAAFFDFVMREENTGAQLRVAPHQRLTLEFIAAHPHCVLMLPVGTSKTFSLAAMALYQLGHEPEMRGGILSATQQQAKKPLKMIRDYIGGDVPDGSSRMRLVFPGLKRSEHKTDPWRDDAITVHRKPGIRDASVTAYGLDGALPGSRLNWILVDDVLNAENTSTPSQRTKIYDFIMSSVFNRLDPQRSRFVASNTSWHPDDLVHRLCEQGWPTLRMDLLGDIEFFNVGDWEPSDPDMVRPSWPGSNLCRLSAHDPDPSNEVGLWPERYPATAVEEIRIKLPALEFNRAYRNLTRDNDSASCKQEWIDLCKKKARELGHYSFVNELHGALTFTGVDLASAPGEQNDKVCLFTFEAMATGHRRILEIQLGQWDAKDIIERIISAQRRYDSIVTVENNGCQRWIQQLVLDKDASLPVKAFTTGRNKAHPEHGVQSVFVEMSNGAWLIPNDRNGKVHPHVAEWVQGCMYYAPSMHTHDALMAQFFAREEARRFGALAIGREASAQATIGPSITSR